MSLHADFLEINRANPEQPTIDELSALIVSNFRNDPMYAAYDPLVLESYIASNSPERTAETLANLDTACFVATMNARLAGAVVLSYYKEGYPDEDSIDSWRIRRLHVGFAFRSLGISSRLLATAENFVSLQGHNTIYAEPTPEAALLFLAKGWQGTSVDKPVSYRNAAGERTSVTVPRFIAHKILVPALQAT